MDTQAPRHTVLCVDDEHNVLHSLKRLLRKEAYRILTADSGETALKLLEQHQVHIVLSDQRMPGMNGTELLSRIKDLYPETLRIMLTGYTDVDSITESINKGHIYKFFLKPWNDHTLKLEIRQALEQYELIKANKRLDETVVQQNRQLKEINERLETMVEKRTMEIALKNQALEISQAVLEDLPTPIIGVDRGGMVVLTNKSAQSIFRPKKINVGGPLDDLFPDMIGQQVSEAVSSGRRVRTFAMSINDKAYEVQITPLSDRFKGHGVIISLLSNKG
jgi:YesN/AraC family two-component response regulator